MKRRQLVLVACGLAACSAPDPATSGSNTSSSGASGSSSSGAADSSSGEPSDPLHYLQFSFVGIALENQADGLDWYRDVLGLTPQGVQWFGLADGRSSVEVFSGGIASAMTKTSSEQSTVVGLQVPDLEASMAALEGRGVTFDGPIDSFDDELWVYLADPEGNRLELKQIGPAGPGLEVSRIVWAGMHVGDLDAMTAWYRDTLGLDQIDDHSFYQLADGSCVELFDEGAASSVTKTAAEQSVVVSLVVEDLDATLTELATRGVEMIEPIVEYDEDDWPDEVSTAIEDPEGNRILIKQFTQ